MPLHDLHGQGGEVVAAAAGREPSRVPGPTRQELLELAT
jgi:hypothetical protein